MMKLYSTIASERAQKSQGGNKFISIEVVNNKGEILFKAVLTPNGTLSNLSIKVNRTQCNGVERLTCNDSGTVTGVEEYSNGFIQGSYTK